MVEDFLFLVDMLPRTLSPPPYISYLNSLDLSRLADNGCEGFWTERRR